MWLSVFQLEMAQLTMSILIVIQNEVCYNSTIISIRKITFTKISTCPVQVLLSPAVMNCTLLKNLKKLLNTVNFAQRTDLVMEMMKSVVECLQLPELARLVIAASLLIVYIC